MRFKLVFIILFSVLMVSSGLQASALPSGDDSPKGIVFKIYRDFAWEAVMAGGWGGLLEQPKEVLSQYFDANLTSLLLKDRVLANKEGMGNLDFSPIWASQDPSAVDMKITGADKPNLVKVEFRYPSNGQKIELTYKVTKTNRGWRISNIIGKDWSLLSILNPSK
jgi:hypothetical protein